MHRKGQFTIEYLLSLLIFLTTVSYIYYLYGSESRNYRESLKKEEVFLEAYTLSEVLCNTPGAPANWNNPYAADVIGFLDDNYNLTGIISYDKVMSLDEDTCNQLIKEKLHLKRNFLLEIKDAEDPSLFTKTCIPAKTYSTKITAEVKRLVAYMHPIEGPRYAIVKIFMWEI